MFHFCHSFFISTLFIRIRQRNEHHTKMYFAQKCLHIQNIVYLFAIRINMSAGRNGIETNKETERQDSKQRNV